MKLHLLAIGQKMPDWVSRGYQEYSKRMTREVTLNLIELKAEKRSSTTNVEHIKAAERDRILTHLPPRSSLWVLDEHGEQVTTLALAEGLRIAMTEGQDICCVIGGADGLHDDIKSRANKLIALSRLTLPHALVRVVLAEQLYRALSVLNHHPYHRE